MLKCRDIAELATRLIDHALPPRQRAAARLHLFLCGPCRRYMDQMRKTVRFLASAPPPPPPEHEDQIVALLTSGRRDN